MGKCSRTGISPVIAELLIVSLAIAVSIVVIGYIMGWFAGASGGTESVYVYPDSKLILDYNNNSVYAIVHLYSNYNPSIKFIHVYIDEGDAVKASILNVVQGNATVQGNSTVILSLGTEAYIKFKFNINPNSITPSIDNRKEIRIVTDQGILVRGMLRIERIGG